MPQDPDSLSPGPYDTEAADEADLWFLPGPDEEPEGQIPGLPRHVPPELAQIADWLRAEAGLAARLAHVAARLGALDDRLSRAPEGWRHRLALTEAADLGWLLGDRVPADRLALWVALRLSGVHDDAAALARAGWAFRRLTSGAGPQAGLVGFLGRHGPLDPQPGAEPLAGRVEGWSAALEAAGAMHPLSRACLGYHLWPLAALGRDGDRLEAAVTAARLAAADCRGGAVFVPLTGGGGAGLRAGGPVAERLGRWLDGIEGGVLAAMLHLDRLEAWRDRAVAQTAALSGRTPALLLQAFAAWPLVSAPMAEKLTGASRAAVQRNLLWFQDHGLIREITGQGRFRFWRAALR